MNLTTNLSVLEPETIEIPATQHSGSGLAGNGRANATPAPDTHRELNRRKSAGK